MSFLWYRWFGLWLTSERNTTCTRRSLFELELHGFNIQWRRALPMWCCCVEPWNDELAKDMLLPLNVESFPADEALPRGATNQKKRPSALVGKRSNQLGTGWRTMFRLLCGPSQGSRLQLWPGSFCSWAGLHGQWGCRGQFGGRLELHVEGEGCH